MTRRIVVIGGGYGGVAFIKKLRSVCKDISITLIDRNACHTVLTEVHQVAAGNRAPETISVPFAGMAGVRFIQAEVTGLEPEGRQIFTTAGPVDYDLLVLALGGVDTDFGVPGVKEHTLMLHSLRDALTIRGRLAELEAGAPVLVAGGGLTGVELAAEIGLQRGGTGNITLVEAAPTLLPGLAGMLQLGARRRLGALGVNVLTGARIARAEAGMVHFADGSALPFALMIWACGVRANPLIARLGLAVDRAGRAIVDETMMTELPGVYAIGDCAAGGFPPTAQAAALQGANLAGHIAGLLAGRPRPLRPIQMRGTLVDLGHTFGVGSVGDTLHMAGWLPALMKRANVARWLWTAAGLPAALRYFLGLERSLIPPLPGAGARAGSPE